MSRLVLVIAFISIIFQPLFGSETAGQDKAKQLLMSIHTLCQKYQDGPAKEFSNQVLSLPDADLENQLSALHEINLLAKDGKVDEIYDRFVHPRIKWQVGHAEIDQKLRSDPAPLMPKDQDEMLKEIAERIKGEIASGIVEFDQNTQFYQWVMAHDVCSFGAKAKETFAQVWTDEKSRKKSGMARDRLLRILAFVESDEGKAEIRKKVKVTYERRAGFMTVIEHEGDRVGLARFDGKWLLSEW